MPLLISSTVCSHQFPLRLASNDNNNNTTIEPSPPTTTKSATPMPIQNGCRQPNETLNSSFNSAGGQKIKG